MRDLALFRVAPAFLIGCGSGGRESGYGSGQSGTVTLTADGEKTKVVIKLAPPAAPESTPPAIRR